jgi:hypothetical protein
MEDCKKCGIAKLESLLLSPSFAPRPRIPPQPQPQPQPQLQPQLQPQQPQQPHTKGPPPDKVEDAVVPLRHAHTKPVFEFSFPSYGRLVSDSAIPILNDVSSGDLSAHVLKRGRVKRMFGLQRRAGGSPSPSPLDQLSVFPPIFDTRLYYRSCHQPMKIEDQGSCASCVFISAASVAQIRGNITLFKQMAGSRSAVEVWRELLRKNANSYDEAADSFASVMADMVPEGVRLSMGLPLLDWSRFICCETQSEIKRACAARLGDCYHHQDGDPGESTFTCEKSVTGVVPHHFVEWVSTRGFHDKSGRLVILKLKAEGEGDSLVSKYSLAKSITAEEVDDDVAAEIAEQVRAIKMSLMANGPIMVMMRIHGKNFDQWGQDKKLPRVGYVLPGKGQMDEYHEVMAVGWSVDDEGKPCWIIQNSYGPSFNDTCAITDRSPLTQASMKRRLAEAYAQAELGAGGFVFVRMVDAELIENDIGSGLENNALAFIPAIKASYIRSGGDRRSALRRSTDPRSTTQRSTDRESSDDIIFSYAIIAAVILAVIVVSMKVVGRK